MKKRLFIFILFLLIGLGVKAEGEATLKYIKVNNQECHCTGYNCSIEVDATLATITYELTDPSATVDRNSGFSVDLSSQVTNIKITVTNELDGTKRENTYSIDIVQHEKSGDYTLKSLKVNKKDITILEEVYVYPYEAKYDEDKIVISATPNDSNAKVKLEKEYEFPLDRSSLPIDFDVKAENGDKKTYRIMLSHGVRPDTSLKSLKIDQGKIDFKKDILEYELTVEYSVNELNIEAEPSDDKASVKIEKEDLVVGENEIKITVTNERAKTEYHLLVKREPNLDKSLANLSSLKILEYPKLDFEENVIEYTLKFSEIPEKLTITSKSKDETGKTVIEGNEKLKDGSIIKVKNTIDADEYQITREYTLKILKSTGVFSSDKKMVIISIIALIITMIILFILEIKEKKVLRHKKLTHILELKKKKDKNKKSEKEVKEVKPDKKNEVDDDLEII